MKKKYLPLGSLLLVAFLFSLLFGQESFAQEFLAQEKDHYQRIRIYVDQAEALEKKADMCLDHCCAAPGIDKNGPYVEGDFADAELELIERMDLEYVVLFENSNDFYRKNRKEAAAAQYKSNTMNCAGISSPDFEEYPTPDNFEIGSMEGFYTYVEMLENMANMRSLYPDLITDTTAIGDFLTHQDRPIYHQIITAPNAPMSSKEQILYTGIHHAREPMSMVQNIFLMWYVLENYGSDEMVTYLLDNFELHFVPCINPDGYVYNENNFIYDENGEPDFHFWRKNARDNNEDGLFTGTGDGVDLNRNYGFLWGYSTNGSSGNTSSSTYRGPSAFSEPETQAMRFLCEDNDYKVAFNYHSYGNLLIYPWGFAVDTLTPDSTQFEVLADLYIQENRYTPGTGNQTVGYLINGDSDDWMYGEQTTKNKIYAFTPEVGTVSQGFYPPMTEIHPLIQNTVWQNLSAAASLGSFAYLKDVSSTTNIETSTGSIDVELQQMGLESGQFTTTFTSLSPNFELTGTTSFVSSTMIQGDIEPYNLPYNVLSDAEPGEEFKIALAIDNGLYTYHDTISKLNFTPDFDFMYSDSFEEINSIDNWTVDILGPPDNFVAWGITGEEAFKGNKSLTDSPGIAYLNSQDYNVTLTEPIDLTAATWAQVSFFALWEMEPLNDYAQAIAVLSDGTEVPLCGQLTKVHPTLNEPIYHGQQSRWEREIIDLSDFLGQSIQLRFNFTSNEFVRKEGFYLDELEIRVLHGDPVAFTGNVLLEGPYDTNEGNMISNLLSLDLLPTEQSYDTDPYFYDGPETISPSELPETVVDWVLLEMRAGVPSLSQQNTTVAERKAGLLLENGEIVGLDGVSPIVFNSLTIGSNYHVCIRHRNHLAVLSSTPITAADSVNYDFTTDINQAWGVNQLKEISPNVYAMYAGDFTKDGVIQNTDYDAWQFNSAVLNSYISTDANLDGVVQVTDYDAWFENKAKIGTPEVQF